MLNVFLFLINLSYAADTSYTHVKEGQKAPFDGILMTNDALIQMIATQETEVKTCELDKKTQLELQKNELNTKYQLYEARCESEKKMNEELITIRDEQLKKDKAKDIIQRAAFFGGFVLGATTSVGIVYSLNQN
jgi:hypothetical protein